VLRTTTFLRAGLRFGVKGTATLTFDCDGDPFPVTVTIDTTDRYFPFLRFSHPRRSHPPLLEEYQIGLLTTPQRYGGLRWWFECPRTGKRSVKLFLPLGGHRFWSRAAYRLGYASQREDRMGRAQRQAIKVYKVLGGDGHWMDGPPPKPKWMRWRTYERRADKLDYYNTRFDGAWSVGAMRFLARSG